MGRGFQIVSSTKQKSNTRSSTESELVGVDDMMPIIVWSCYFLMAQGYGVTQNLLLQDNKSNILLEKNGKASSGKHTQYINIRYFFITDRVNMKEVEIKWCPTKEMVADFMTKPLQGSHFKRLRNLIMGMASIKKAEDPSKHKSRLLEGNKSSKKSGSSSSVKVMAQKVCHRSVLGLYNHLDWYGRYIHTCTYIQKNRSKLKELGSKFGP
jgi:hypothetical protein